MTVGDPASGHEPRLRLADLLLARGADIEAVIAPIAPCLGALDLVVSSFRALSPDLRAAVTVHIARGGDGLARFHVDEVEHDLRDGAIVLFAHPSGTVASEALAKGAALAVLHLEDQVRALACRQKKRQMCTADGRLAHRASGACGGCSLLMAAARPRLMIFSLRVRVSVCVGGAA